MSWGKSTPSIALYPRPCLFNFKSELSRPMYELVFKAHCTSAYLTDLEGPGGRVGDTCCPALALLSSPSFHPKLTSARSAKGGVCVCHVCAFARALTHPCMCMSACVCACVKKMHWLCLLTLVNFHMQDNNSILTFSALNLPSCLTILKLVRRLLASLSISSILN